MAGVMVSEAVVVALIAAGGVFLTALGAGFGAWVQGRTAKRQVEAGAYERARSHLSSTIDALQERVTDLEGWLKADREEAVRMRGRIRELEHGREENRQAIEQLVEYVRVLRDLLRQHRITPPQGPQVPGLEDTGPSMPAVT